MIYVRMYSQNNILLSAVQGIKVQTRSGFQLKCDCAEDINKH